MITTNAILVEMIGFEGLDLLPDKIDLPFILVSPEKIFSNEVPLLDVNIINPNKYTNEMSGEDVESAVGKLQQTIADWYIALRNLAIVGLLSILVYIGIRMILSSTSADKAKYKQTFMDWLIALCLLFFIHYIMSFSITIVESLTEAIKQTNQSIEMPIQISDIKSKYKTGDYDALLDKVQGPNGGYVTDLMGVARFRAQLNYAAQGRDDDIVAEGGRAQMAYTIIYFVLVIYTIMFLFIYIRRMIYIIFLTMISPLVVLTYPIDKLNDGQAQAFNMWLKEYIFNLLIQPLHLLIYNILLGSAMNLATQYMIYPLVVLGFMLPAEKILRKFFGFEKSSTASSIASGALGGAAVMTAINKLGSGAKKAIKGAKGGGDTAGKDGDNDKIRMSDRTADDPDNEDDYITQALNGEQNPAENEEENKPIDVDYVDLDNKPYTGTDPYRQQIKRPNTIYNNGYISWQDIKNKATDIKDSVVDAKDRMKQGTKNIGNKIGNTKVIKGAKTLGNGFKAKASKLGHKVGNSKAIKGAKTFGKGMGALAGRYVVPNIGKAGMGLLTGTAKGIGAATLGTIGVAAGIASDDYDNVAKYGVAAAAIGAGIGGNIGNKMINLPSNAYRKASEVGDTYRQATLSQKEYQNYINKRLDNEFMRNRENQELFKSNFGTAKETDDNGNKVEAYRRAMEDALKYREQGVTDNKVIIKAMKAKSRYASESRRDQRRITSAKFASQVSNEKDIETLQKRLKEKGIKEPQIKDQSDMIRQIRGLY